MEESNMYEMKRTVNCIFLFSVAFVIIIVYKGDMCRPPA